MQILRSVEDIATPLVKTVATIGNFDGVHLGHREIFRKVKQAAQAVGGVSLVITFIPHPLKVLPNINRQISLINTYAEKELLIDASGIDYLLTIPFTPEFAETSPREFVSDLLVKRLGVTHLIIGYDYSFGKGRGGDVSTLKALGREMGFTVEVLEPIALGGSVYSSTAIRRLIQDGDVSGVVPMLGRHFSLGGVVVEGHHRGAGLGFPTANISTDKELIPKPGVYAVKVKIDDILYDGACNIGNNPTFNNTESSIEVFLFNFDGNLYGRSLRVYFIDRIRDERRFSGIDELQKAIAADVEMCREILSSTPLIEYRAYLEGCLEQ